MTDLPVHLDAAASPTADEDVQALLAFVAVHDVPCPACGYNLRQLTQPTCPECGLTLKLTVGSAEPFKRAWGFALALSAMIAGLGMVMILMTIAQGVPDFYDSAEYIFYYGSIIWVPAPALLLIFRRKFCKMAGGIQYAIILLAVLSMMVIGLSLISLG